MTLNNSIKPMVYDSKKRTEIICEGNYKGYYFKVYSLGVYPCVYLRLPDNHKYYGIEHHKLDFISCHGGFTFSGHNPKVDIQECDSSTDWWFGWHYAHYGDYISCLSYEIYGRIWTTEKIVSEVKSVIDQLEMVRPDAIHLRIKK